MILTPGQLNRRAELYHQLGSMIAAGVPLIQALEMASRNRAVKGSKKIIPILVGHLQSGRTFSDSMAYVHGWMPEFDTILLSVGEQSGRLDVSFKLLAAYYAARAKIIRDAIARSIITIATLHVFLMIFPLGLWISFWMGVIDGNYPQCIPFLVEKIVVFGSLYGTIFILVYACQGKHGQHWRTLVESLVQLIPFLRKAQKYLALSRLTAALEALINAGVSVVRSWDLAAGASGSPRLKRYVSAWPAEFDSGKTSAELVFDTPYFPEMFVNLYTTGEHSGKLDEALARLQAYYHEEGFRELQIFTRFLNGIIYGSVALLVAIYVIRFWMHYYGALLNSV